jgi:prepilin-type N-terminal cleavage/methylation domain-containing protein
MNSEDQGRGMLSRGFTIIELLVTITIIGVITAITIVSYTGVTQKVSVEVLKASLIKASKTLRAYNSSYGYYPTTLDTNGCPSTPTASTKYCIKFDSGDIYTYKSVSPITFHLTATRGNISYSITNNTQPAVATTEYNSSVGYACPLGFIPVPGSGTYGTNDFCVMKYEAKADDNGDGTGDTNQTTGSNTWPANTYPISNTRKLVSTAAGYPVASISQAASIDAASSYTANCDTGCHLITEAEWMTIAQNVLSVSDNWTNSDGSVNEVGTGYIYSGSSDNSPAYALEANTDDNDGYAGTGHTYPSNQRRTLKLSNGETVWDMSGNVYEVTQGAIAGNQQPGLSGDSTYAWKEWNDSSLLMSGLASTSQPSSTGIPGITWYYTSGVGRLNSYYGETAQHIFRRSGAYSTSTGAGIVMLNLNGSSTGTSTVVGLRVAR